MRIIPHNQPGLGNEEISALQKIIKSNYIIGGEEVRKLEKNISKRIGLKYAVATNSGTSALHLSLLALDIKPGDEVIAPSYTAGDVLNAINYTNATPVIVDIESGSFNIDPLQVKNRITNKTRALIVPHMLGSIANISDLEKLGIPIINDCAQSFGAIYKGKHIESFGDITILSFFATKIMTTGQGGMVLTNNKRVYDFTADRINYNGRDNYKTRYNYPLTDLSAAIGNSQLKKLDKFLDRRKKIAGIYHNALDGKKIQFHPMKGDNNSNFYRFILVFESSKKRAEAQKIFTNKNISTIIPVKYYELLHNCLGLNKDNFRNSEDLAWETLSIPIFPSLTQEEVMRIARVLRNL